MWNRQSSREATSRVIGVLFVLTLIGAGGANAIPVTYSFTGTAALQTGIYVGQGTAVTGFYTVESDMIDGDPTGETDSFTAITSPSAGWEISVTNGSVTRSSAENQNLAGTIHHTLRIEDGGALDEWALFGSRVIASDDYVQLIERDFGLAGGDPDAIAFGSGNLIGTPITTPGDLSLYDSSSGLYEAYDEAGALEGRMGFALTSVVLIPEPTAGLLIGLGLVGLGARRRSN